MSGQSGITGYALQTIIALFESLNNEWEYVQIEPKTEYDKVDIIWYINGNKNVSQVKSTIGIFNKPEIERWINDLKKDIPNANRYIITIIGDATKEAKTFARNFIDDIKVIIYPLNKEILIETIISKLDKFLNENKYYLSYQNRHLVSKALITDFLLLSTNGKKVSKEYFMNIIIDYIRYNFKDILKSTQIKLSFYKSNIVNQTCEIGKITVSELDSLNFFNLIIEETKLLFDKIDNIRLSNNNIYEDLSISNLYYRYSQLNYENQPVYINIYEQERISLLSKEILDKYIKIDFFNFGNLKETKKSASIFNQNLTYIGTEDEKKKLQLYNNFYNNLISIKYLNKYWNIIQKYNLLPIVVMNDDIVAKRNLIINLKFPKYIKIISDVNFAIPSRKRDSILSKFIKDDGEFINELRHKTSSNIENDNNNFEYDDYIFHNMITGYDRYEEMRYLLGRIFKYTIYHEQNHTIIQVKLDSISSNSIKSLPCYIFFQTNKNFEIEYSINSDNQTEKVTGKLNFNNQLMYN